MFWHMNRINPVWWQLQNNFTPAKKSPTSFLKRAFLIFLFSFSILAIRLSKEQKISQREFLCGKLLSELYLSTIFLGEQSFWCRKPYWGFWNFFVSKNGWVVNKYGAVIPPPPYLTLSDCSFKWYCHSLLPYNGVQRRINKKNAILTSKEQSSSSQLNSTERTLNIVLIHHYKAWEGLYMV